MAVVEERVVERVEAAVAVAARHLYHTVEAEEGADRHDDAVAQHRGIDAGAVVEEGVGRSVERFAQDVEHRELAEVPAEGW